MCRPVPYHAGGQQHIVDDVQIGYQMKHLEDKADVLSPISRPFWLAHRVDVVSSYVNLTGRRAQHRSSGQQKRRLATAARASDDDEIPFLNMATNLIQSFKFTTPGSIYLTDVLETYQFHTSPISVQTGE